MRGNWIKIVLFVLAAFMLASITEVMLDTGVGKPDESRRTKHPAGFSFIPPGGWGGSVFYSNGPDDGDWMRVSPEKSTGRQPVIGINRYHKPPAISDEVPFTFQGQPATKSVSWTRNSWTWRIHFVREGVNYSISATYPVETDVEGGPLWPFIQSFRVEPVIDLLSEASATSLNPGAATQPATAPSTGPAAR